MLAQMDAILDAYETTDDPDYLLYVVVADWPALSVFFSQTLSQHQNRGAHQNGGGTHPDQGGWIIAGCKIMLKPQAVSQLY